MRRSPPQTKQNAVGKAKATFTRTGLDIAQVLKTYSDRVTCDVRLLDGLELRNVPIRTNCGIVDEDKVYGEIDMPIVHNYVVIQFVGGRPWVIGNTFPFLNELFLEGRQLLAGPRDITGPDMKRKQHTTKLLEKGKPRTWKRVFPSGTTIEVNDDGAVYIETVNLSKFVLHIDPDDPNNSLVEWKSAVTSDDKFCRIVMKATSDGILIEDAIHGSTIKINSAGMELRDFHGNVIQTIATKVVINSNFEVLQ